MSGCEVLFFSHTFPQIVGYLDLPLDEALSGVKSENYAHILTQDGECVGLLIQGETCKPTNNFVSQTNLFEIIIYITNITFFDYCIPRVEIQFSTSKIFYNHLRVKSEG